MLLEAGFFEESPGDLGGLLPRRILREDVELDVHALTLLHRSERGDLSRGRDERDRERVGFGVDDREADAVDRDRSFGNHLCGERRFDL